MQAEVLYRPSYSVARVTLAPGEAARAEGGAMIAMSPGVSIETAAQGGLMASLKRSVLGGETFFMNTFRAPANQPGEVLFAPTLPGDVVTQDLSGESLLVQSGAYLASAESVNVDTKFGGGRTFFASEGLILLRVSGQGLVILSSYGAIHELTLAAGQHYTVDTGHVVAFSADMSFNVRRIGGIKSTLFSGEGLVVDVGGPGRLLIQTRSQDAFLSWLIPKLPHPKES
jgi:uncharacterized protein (TIGR00266 family)